MHDRYSVYGGHAPKDARVPGAGRRVHEGARMLPLAQFMADQARQHPGDEGP